MTDKAPEYLASRISERLAEDPATAELGIRVTVKPGWLLVSGVVATQERCQEILRIVHEEAPDVEVHSDITVAEAAEPSEQEILS
jgi:osmotically-inducible protein OsmY